MNSRLKSVDIHKWMVDSCCSSVSLVHIIFIDSRALVQMTMRQVTETMLLVTRRITIRMQCRTMVNQPESALVPVRCPLNRRSRRLNLAHLRSGLNPRHQHLLLPRRRQPIGQRYLVLPLVFCRPPRPPSLSLLARRAPSPLRHLMHSNPTAMTVTNA